jgi:hypothetical protein
MFWTFTTAFVFYWSELLATDLEVSSSSSSSSRNSSGYGPETENTAVRIHP